MPTKKDESDVLVHIYPVEGVSVPPQDFDPSIRAIEQDVPAEVWARLEVYTPLPFTTTPTPPLPSPAQPPTGPSDQDGPPDSEVLSNG